VLHPFYPTPISLTFAYFQAESLTAPVGAQIKRFSFVFMAVGCTILCMRLRVT
jgi:hypothetical protein